MDRVVRVLVVDDSAYVRKVVREMLSRSALLEVVGVARDGAEALEMVDRLKPDVVTCDLIMPGVGGVEFIRRQMAARPVPIVIVSIAAESSERVLSGLDAGAIDFVQKPTALATERVFDLGDELIVSRIVIDEAEILDARRARCTIRNREFDEGRIAGTLLRAGRAPFGIAFSDDDWNTFQFGK